METILETIELDVDEPAELLFKVKVEGASSPAKARLVCEGKSLGVVFNGRRTADASDVVQFEMPALKNSLGEGTYDARVEVIVDNRVFVPVEFNLKLKKTVSVVAESIQVPLKKAVDQPTVTAVIQAKKQPQSSTQTLRQRYETKTSRK